MTINGFHHHKAVRCASAAGRQLCIVRQAVDERHSDSRPIQALVMWHLAVLALLKLALVFGGVEVSLRDGYKTIGSNLPFFIPANSDALPRTRILTTSP
jgi:type VI protein secretion system component VasF